MTVYDIGGRGGGKPNDDITKKNYFVCIKVNVGVRGRPNNDSS